MTTGLTDLERLEREAFRRFYDDGLVDVYIGTMLIVMGATTIVTDRSDDINQAMLVMLAVAFAVTVPLLVLRRHLLRSRLGTFQPGPERRRRIRGTRLALLGSVVAGVMMFAVVATLQGEANDDLVGPLLPAVWFLNGVIVFGAGAYFLNVPRFYFTGVMWGLAMPLMIWPDVIWDYRLSPWIALGLPGAVIVAVGLYKLVTFLRAYPISRIQETMDA